LNRPFADRALAAEPSAAADQGHGVRFWAFTARWHRPKCSDCCGWRDRDEANGEAIRGPAGELASGAAGRVCLAAKEEDN
jgi:hypothetical protein